LFGGFDLDEFSPIEQVKKSKVATIFVHGDTDGYVPMEMSERNYEACSAKHKKLVIIKGADHGLAYPVGRQEYLDILSEFFAPVIK
jgi:fermentation-respiration switch protein FrsA (DUF1100 family)